MAPAPGPTIDLLDGVTLSQPSQYKLTGAHHGYRQATVAHNGRLNHPRFGVVLEPFQPVRDAWLSWIEPGGFVVCHIDAGPHYERWQLPITGFGSLNGERAEPGVPFRVHHDRWHHVRNDDTHPRVVLVIDRDTLASRDRTPFRVCPAGHGCRSEHQ